MRLIRRPISIALAWRGIEVAVPFVKDRVVRIGLAQLPQGNPQRRAAEPCLGTIIGAGIETALYGMHRAGFFGAVFRRTPKLEKRAETRQARRVEGFVATQAIEQGIGWI